MLSKLNHITLATVDLDESLRFYRGLGFQAHVRWDKGAYLSLGDLWLCLSLGDVSSSEDYTHLAFSIQEEDFAALESYISEQKIPLWQDNSSEGKSIYFLDPSGHKLEAHIGSLQSRLDALKSKPYSGLQWLD